MTATNWRATSCIALCYIFTFSFPSSLPLCPLPLSLCPPPRSPFQHLESLFSVDAAHSDTLHLSKGSDTEYEAAMERKLMAERALNQLLAQQKAALHCPKLKFSGSGKVCEHVHVCVCVDVDVDGVCVFVCICVYVFCVCVCVSLCV
jgi:hypothetical protein